MTTVDHDRAWALALGAVAPAQLSDNVLVEVGLVDAFATIPTPLGDVFVAWNGRGVSAADLALDAASFARAHEARCPCAWSGRSGVASRATGGHPCRSTCAATPTSSRRSG
jgi:hypothetical protein